MGPVNESCYNCRRPLRESDFRMGRAIRVGSLASCEACAEPLLARLTPEQQRTVFRQISGKQDPEVDDAVSVEYLPADEAPPPAPSGTQRIRSASPRHTTTFGRVPPPASRRGIPPAVWAAGAGLILLVLLFALAGRRRTPQAPAPSREAPAAPRERSRPPAAPSPAPRSSGADPAPLREAVAALEQKTRTAAERAEYGKALARLESERARHAAPEWGQAVDRLTREIRDGAGGRFVRLKPKAIDARQQGNEDAVDAFRAEVAAWGIPSFVEELDQAIEAVPSPRSSARLCAGIPPESFAGTQGPFDLDGDGAVRNWLIAGPFPNPDVSGGLHVDYLDGETRHVPKAGREVRAPSGASVAWTPYAGTNRVIELKKLPQLVLNGSRDHLLAYAACWLECVADVRTEVRIGSDDGYKLWVDSALVGQKDGDRGYRHDQESYPVRLAKGRHLLLLKIYNYTSGYQFGLRLVSSSGSPPRGLRVWN